MNHPRNAAIFAAVCDALIPGPCGTTLRSAVEAIDTLKPVLVYEVARQG